MRDHNQDSDAAQSGRRKDGEENDNLEPTRDGEVAAEHITPDSTSLSTIPAEEGSIDLRSDGGCIGEADTDRHELGAAFAGGFQADRELPTSLVFTLRNICSLNAECLFCKETGCDLIFMARSPWPDKTKGYAVHSQCVFDHELLQDLGSRGT